MSMTLPSPSDCCSPCAGLSVTIIDTSGGTFTVALATDIYGLPSAATNTIAVAQDEYVAGDGNGGVWRYSTTSVAADNFPLVIVPTDGLGGRWLKVV